MGLSNEEWTVEYVNRFHRQNRPSDASRQLSNCLSSTLDTTK